MRLVLQTKSMDYLLVLRVYYRLLGLCPPPAGGGVAFSLTNFLPSGGHNGTSDRRRTQSPGTLSGQGSLVPQYSGKHWKGSEHDIPRGSQTSDTQPEDGGIHYSEQLLGASEVFNQRVMQETTFGLSGQMQRVSAAFMQRIVPHVFP